MFLSKIRERQFAKKWRGAYNLSRAVLAGVLAAGCLMPGFAEAAPGLLTSSGVDYTRVGNTATITKNIESAAYTQVIYWHPGDGETVVEGHTIDVKGVNSTSPLTITPEISIRGGYVDDGNAISNTVNISNVTFEDMAYVYGGRSGNPYSSAAAIYSGNTSSYGTVTGNTVTIKDTSFERYSEIFGGFSESGIANKNSVSISDSTINSGAVLGGVGNTAANNNSVSISGGTFNDELAVHGGHSASGEANGNSVIISGGTFGSDTVNSYVFGGYSISGTANENSVIISGGTIYGLVSGGYVNNSSGTAKENKVILVGNKATYKFTDTQGAEQTLTGSGNIEITGPVYGGLTFGTHFGNELHVYGSDTKVGGIAGFDNLNFYINHKMTYGDVMLTITGQGDTYISASNVIVNVDGAPKAKDDLNTITLIQKTGNGVIHKPDDEKIKVNFGPLLTGTGSVALVNKDLVLTLKNITVNENGKSLVETRAAAAFVVNNMSDFMLGTGMEQAKAAAGGVTPIDEGKLTPFAAIGGSNMRYTTGSYVDVNGWNGAVGFAKQSDKLLFGVAVEHGRGNYDSYLDNGMHASGDIKSTGGVIFGEYKLDNGVHYDAALRAGRVKSDYNSTATSYDESSTYYGFSLGGGKELTVSDKATLDVYGRYYFSHTNGSDVSIATGEEIDFDAVNSHRLRIGGRYTTTLTEKSKAYAGLAWQYEFGGDAKAAINGYSAPTPSLQGHSAIVEAGYKLNAGKNLTLDFNLNGAMGKQRGIGGGIGAQWLF